MSLLVSDDDVLLFVRRMISGTNDCFTTWYARTTCERDIG